MPRLSSPPVRWTPPNQRFTPDPADYMGQAFYDLLSRTPTYTSAVYNWASTFVIGLPSTSSSSCDKCRWQGEKLIFIYTAEHDFLTPAQRAVLIDRYFAWLGPWDGVAWGGRKYPDNGALVSASPDGNYFMGYTRNAFEAGVAFLNDTAAAWQPSHDYGLYTFITDVNNHLQEVTTAGTSCSIAHDAPRTPRNDRR